MIPQSGEIFNWVQLLLPPSIERMETLQAVHSERFSNYFLQLDQLLKNMARILNIQMLTSFQKTENIKINFLKFLTENCQMTLKRSHLRAFLNKI